MADEVEPNPPASPGGAPGSAVIAVAASPGHTMSKHLQPSIRLLTGLGVDGDTHLGTTVQHRSRVAKDPTQPNLRQVHLIHAELHDRLRAEGFDVGAGDMGENVTTRGIDLLGLPTGTRLAIGPSAVIEVTGLRNPCIQLDGLRPGLMGAVTDRDEAGNLVRLAGVMAVVVADGDVRAGDAIDATLPVDGAPLRPV